ncbi:galactosyltransferase-related protein [Flavobacterium sp. CAU 1735]|uniref:glycosyltransferase family 2 protein n=1 Tax=Flavobacterium sp. CAU 1735 TaxID=3140361 RepID=UPI0032614DE2
MITVIYPYRNRDLERVRRSLDSLQIQTDIRFKVVLVDYGSDQITARAVQELAKQYAFVEYHYLFTTDQPWSRSIALNYAIRKADTDYCFMADIDMIFAPDFMAFANQHARLDEGMYFPVGFLSEAESTRKKSFDQYVLKFSSSSEAAGMSLFPTAKLHQIRGYDQFFHFWGSEDNDIHNRLKQLGCPIRFCDDKIRMLHQWHPNFRQTESALLKQELQLSGVAELNQEHFRFNQQRQFTTVNSENWGIVIDEKDYNFLRELPVQKITNRKSAIDHLIFGQLPQLKDGETLSVCIEEEPLYNSFKYKLKKILGKKVPDYYTLKESNDLLLRHIVTQYAHLPYTYRIRENLSGIEFKIKK